MTTNPRRRDACDEKTDVMKDADLNKQVGELLRNRRKMEGLNQLYVAGFLGLTRTSMVNIEAGVHALQLPYLYKLCDLYGCQPNDLLPTAHHIKLPDSLEKELEGLPADKVQAAKRELKRLLSQ